MQTIIPMNCGYCFFYRKKLTHCLSLHVPMSSIHTCDNWRPKLYILELPGEVGFALYDQYKLNIEQTKLKGRIIQAS